MSSLNIEYNGKTIPIANVGIVSSKEKVIFGSLERDLLLKTLGSVLILVGNKFYELPFNTDGSWAGGNLNIKDIDGLDNLDLSLYSNGTFLYDTKGNVLYLIHNKTLITISGSDDDNQIFLSYINEQKLSGQQKHRLILNAGQFLSSLQDVKLFTVEDVYDGMIVFVNDEKTHYILSNSRYPNEISSWETFYIGSQGGLIKNGLIIKNQSRENLLYLNEIDAMQNGIFNGLKIGSDEKWMKSSVNILDQSLINYNTKEFLIKNLSYKILHALNNNIGIRGDASGSDDYNIITHGSLKMNGPFFTDKKMVSTDFNTINITHWDGGRGFGLTRGSDSKWNLEIDNLIVRDSLVANKMVLKSLEVERAYATGGHILVTDGAVINSYNYRKPTAEELQTANITYNGDYGTLEADSYYYFVTFKESTEKDDNDAYVSLPTTPAFPSENNLTDNIEKDTLDVDKNCPFIAGDVLLCQTASGLTAKRYYAYVSYSTNKYIAIKSNHLRNNVIYLRDNEGNPVSIFKDFSIEANDSLIRITNLLTDNEGVYKNKNRRRFIDIDGTRNQITMYDNLGNPNLFSGTPNADGFYDDIEIITGIGQNGSLRLRMGELSDLGINGITGYGLYCDNVLLKGKLIVKDPSGEYPIGATKGAWIPGNTNTYYLNDIISYNGSAYRCIVQHTNTAELLAVPGISDFWEVFVEKGSDGTVDQDFTSVEIAGELIFIYDKTNQTYDKSSIPLTATLKGIKPENVTEAKFQWKINDVVIYETIYNDEQITEKRIVNSANIYPSGSHEDKDWSTIWQSNRSLSVYCYVYLNQSITESYFDVMSISKLSDGLDGTDGIDGIDGSNSISAFLTNDSHSIPTDANGNNPNFSGASSRIYIYNGGIDDTANWTITFVESGVSGTKSGSTYTVTGITADSGYVDFIANRTGYSQITKRFNIKKLKAGAAGSSPEIYEITPNFYLWSKDNNSVLTPSSIVFNFYKTVGTTRTAFIGYFDILYSTDGLSFSSYGSGSGSYITVSLESTYKAIKCVLYADSGKTNEVDSQSAIMVSDGKDAYTIVLSNEALTVPCQADGSFVSGIFLSPYKYYTDINVYRGTTKLPLSNTSGWSMEFPSGGLVTMIPTQIDSYTWRANVTGFTGASTVMSGEGLIKINIYTGVYNVATYSFNKSLSLSKALQGPLLDWIKEWDGASTYVDTYKIISPKMFAGSKSGSNYTGVAIGRDVFGLGSNGIAGFYNSTKTFHLDAATGNCVFGNGDNSISYVANTGLINFGKNVALNWNSGYSNLIWRNDDFSDFFKLDPGYKYSLSLKLKSLNLNRILLRKQMKVAGWYSISFWYKLTTSSNFTFTALINDHIAVTITEAGIHDWRFASGSVYVNQYLTDQPYGFVDFETIPSGVDIYISDLMVVEGKNIPLTYSPPMTLINSDGIYTGSLHADLITAGLIGTERLIIDKTLIVGGQSGTGTYNGVISVKNDSNTEVVRLDRNGLYAIAGTIGGFEINSNSIGSNNADSTDRIYLSRNYIRTGKIEHLVAVGQNVIPSGFSGLNVMANAFFRNITVTTGVDKAGIVIEQSNTTGAKDYGLISNASCISPDFVSRGIHYAALNSSNTGSSNSTLFWEAYPLSLNTRYLLYSYALYTLYLPSSYYLSSMFPNSMPTNFAINISLTSRPSNGYNIVIDSISGAIIYNQNGAQSTITLGRGDTVNLLAVSTSDGFYYLIVGFTYG